MKNYLILGASSSIAQYFINKLRSESQRVYTLSSNKGTNWVYDLISIKNKINDSKPEVIINFVGTFVNDYSKSYKVNVLATKNLLDAATTVKYDGKLILIGSAAEYGIQEKYYEGCVEKPRSIYGLTKLMQHSLFQHYNNISNIKTNYIRLFNVCDTKCSNELFIGNFTRQLNLALKGEINEIELGDLTPCRDYLLIDDVYDGFMKVVESGNNGEVYNLGMGKAIFLDEFVKKVLSTLNLHVKLIIKDTKSVGNIRSKVIANINKIKNIGWSPKFNYRSIMKEYCRRVKDEIFNE